LETRTTKEISLAIVFAALYAVGVIVLAPISFNIFQVRVADAMLPLSIIFGWPAIVGITIGTIVSNFFGGLGPIDIVGGSIANFLATLFAWKIGTRAIKGSWIHGIIAEIMTVTIIVGSYLSYLFGMPLEIGLFGVLIGSFIAIGILGYLLLRVISRPFITKTFKAYGLRVYGKKTNLNKIQS
jgi:uncharacterized membrane protein